MKSTLCLAFFATASLAPLSAVADQAAPDANTVNTVVVTAQKRAEQLQDVPLSITAISGSQLAASNVTDIRDLVALTPALRMDQTGIFTQPTIRGVGSGTTGPGASANVATYVDGFYQPSEIGNDFDLSNVSQVEVLKGPQGTLFGRNATGGAILISTKDPSSKPNGDVNLSYRSFNDTRADVYLSTPITDTLSGNLALYGRKSDGFKTDLVTGDHDGFNHTLDLRGKLLWKPTDKLKFLLILQHTDIADPSPAAYNTYDHNSFANGIPGVVVANNYDNAAMPNSPKNTAAASAIYLKSTIDLDWATLTSYTGYRQEKDKEVSQLDRSSLAAFTAVWNQTEETFTQELNLSGKVDKLDWVVGGFYDHDRSGYPFFLFNGYNAGGAAYDTTDAAAGFADVTYQAAPNLYLTGGLRYSNESQDMVYEATGTRGSHTWESWNERLVARYEFSPRSNVYASYSNGFKSGVYNALSFVTTPVNPETIDAYEVGYKTAQSNWQFSSAAYYYSYKNLQFTAYHFDPVTNLTVSALENAAAATIYGAEAQGTYNFTPDFNIRLGAAWTHSRYDSFPGAGAYVPVVNPLTGALQGNSSNPLASATGKTLVRSPDFTLTAGANYTVPLSYGRLTFSGNVYFTTKIYFDPTDTVSQPDYATLDLKVTWTSPDNAWNASFIANNVTDTRYVTQVAEDVFGYGGVYAAPATYGVILSRKF